MSIERPENKAALRDLFLRALDLPSEPEREAYFQEIRSQYPDLYPKLMALWRNEKDDSFLEGPAAERLTISAHSAPLTEGPGTVIGKYKLLEQLGEGGFGVVYMAEQKEPVKRRVALKIIKVGMDTREVVARFEAERQALAIMDHPNIAKVFDAGATERPVGGSAGLQPAVSPISNRQAPDASHAVDGASGRHAESAATSPEGFRGTQTSSLRYPLSAGRPYFVMELVRGVKITEYCDEKNLSTRERLNLFTQVCQAVQHAHQKGIIHRDLKPSNILVTVNDGAPVPKIIDFGIAKATQLELTEKTVFTRFHQFIGTPAYLSPEQADISSVDIDTRSDIYSLGVLLYELLTGKTPFDGKELLKIGLDEMRRTIREKEPERPSTRVTALGAEELTTAAKRRGLEPPKLAHVLRGDLDWIVMKCLEKDRSRRYDTANGLAMDIQRHLNNEPVVACPPSKLYEFQKMVTRNKGAFAATAAVVTALVIGLGLAVWQSLEKTREYRRAVKAEKESEQVSRFFKDMLEGAGPDIAKGRDATILLEILDKADARVAAELGDQPTVEAELRKTIGKIYLELGKYQKGEATYRRALEIQRRLHPEGSADMATALIGVGNALRLQGRLAEAEAMGREGLAMTRKFQGDSDRGVADALPLLGTVLEAEGKVAEAKVLTMQALDLERQVLGNDDPRVGGSLARLGRLSMDEGHPAEAEVKLRESLAIIEKAWGSENSEAAMIQNNLARTLAEEEKWEEAEGAYRDALSMSRKLLGENHPVVADNLSALSALLLRLDKLEEAEKLAREAVEVRTRSPSDADPRRLGESFNCLANVLLRENKPAEAEALYRKTLNMREKLTDEMVANALNNLAQALAKQGKNPEAETKAREGLALTAETPPVRMEVAGCVCNLADILLRQNKLEQAENLLSEPLDLASQKSAPKLLRWRGELAARRARWRDSEVDLARALELNPEDHLVWHSLAAVLVQEGDLAAYRDHCRRSLVRFGQTRDLYTAHRIAKDCLVLPDSGTDPGALAMLTDVSVAATNSLPAQAAFSSTKGLAEYRQGHFSNAVDWSSKALALGMADDAWVRVESYAVLAMAQWRLGQTNAAQQSLTEGSQIAGAELPKVESRDLGVGWLDWIIAQALLREAGGLIETAATPSPASY